MYTWRSPNENPRNCSAALGLMLILEITVFGFIFHIYSLTSLESRGRRETSATILMIYSRVIYSNSFIMYIYKPFNHKKAVPAWFNPTKLGQRRSLTQISLKDDG